ncbi:aldo/keto reductase [uncultured Victivallis sp.]|uniref:aldo/keto reductase n=1 Tax=uncultured Victivallis sp. TaxID=354118 RepID=UPI0025CC2F2F|nr:aldo/keto reductase [uncultured Victivallis sp.]
MDRRDFLKCTLTLAALAPLARLTAQTGAAAAGADAGTESGKLTRRRFRDTDLTLPLLGFGMMRLPQKNGAIDSAAGQKLVDYAMKAGLNYFDTAWPYHGGRSELFVGEALSRYPRESYLLADKLPVRSIKSLQDAERIFQEQLRKCRTGYFDFYLLHALNRGNWETVKRCGLYDFVRRMQKEGKIRYVGFSFHDSPDVLKTIAEAHPWDFVQLQINYLDWHNYRSREQYEIVTKLGIPVIVMEPLRGGTLATLTSEATKILKTSAPDASPADWAFRYVASLPNVICVLSGMNRMDHLKENLRVYSPLHPLSDSERLTLASALAAYQKVDSVPCTACNYCVPCPVEVAIPRVFGAYNQYKIDGNFAAFKKAIDALPNEGGPASCVSCGVCLKKCPQKIDIPTQMKRIAAELKKK